MTLATGGDIAGRVLDKLGKPVADATVSISPLDRETLTDASGDYLLAGIPDGRWKVEATKVTLRILHGSRWVSMKSGRSVKKLNIVVK